MTSLIVISTPIYSQSTEYKKKVARLINAHRTATNEIRLLKKDIHDMKLKSTTQSNMTIIEKEKTAVWKKAYDKEVNKSWIEKFILLGWTAVCVYLGTLL